LRGQCVVRVRCRSVRAWPCVCHTVCAGRLRRRLFLQCDGYDGRVGRLQRGLVLSSRFDVGDAAALRDSFILPGAQSQHDGLSHVALLPGERHECADRVRRWLFLQCDGSERRDWSVQRRVLLRRGLVDCHGVFMHNRHLLPDWKLEYDRLLCGRILPRARAGELYAEPDRLVLRHDGFVSLCAVHGGVVLRHVRSERADGQLQRRVLLPDGLQLVDPGSVAERHLQPGSERVPHAL
jgi:hypothetical protein